MLEFKHHVWIKIYIFILDFICLLVNQEFAKTIQCQEVPFYIFISTETSSGQYLEKKRILILYTTH